MQVPATPGLGISATRKSGGWRHNSGACGRKVIPALLWGELIADIAESCEDCVECSGLDAAQMCCRFSALWPRHWHGAHACFSTMAGTHVAHLISPFQRPNALSPWRRLKCTVFSQPICETSGAANPTISTFTSAGLPLATARDRASSNWSGAVTYSPCPPSAAAARS